MWWRVNSDGEKTKVVVIESSDTEVVIQHAGPKGSTVNRRVPRETKQHRYCTSEEELKVYQRDCLLKRAEQLEERRLKLQVQLVELEAELEKTNKEALSLQ